MATTSEAMGFIGRTQRPRSVLATDWRAPDGRRTLQLALATVWLLDAVLQFQPYMFTKAFGNQMIAGVALGNPAGLAHQITWAGHAIGHHAEVANTTFALVQLAIALGIAWRPTVKIALAGSVVWALAVWWIGEGLGGVLTPTPSPLNGAPGAVILYALLAVLLWPTAASPHGVLCGRPSLRRLRGPGTVARSVGQLGLRRPSGRQPVGAGVCTTMFTSMALGQPHWLSSLDRAAARLVAGRGLAFSIVLAAILVVIAIGAFLPVGTARVTLVVALALAVIIWVVGEGFGDVFSGSGTDPNTGPLLILMAAAFWPRRPAVAPTPAAVSASDQALSLTASGG